MDEQRGNALPERIGMAFTYLDAFPDAALLTDADGIILAVNEVALERFDITDEAAVGACVYDLLPAEVAQTRRKWMAELVASDVPVHAEERHDGRRFRVSLYAAATTDGLVTHVLVLEQDVTEERDVIDEQQRLALLDAANDAIIIFDLDGYIKYWNKGAERQYGWKQDDVRGQLIHSLLQTVFPSPLEEIIDYLFREGRWEGELRHTARAGVVVTVMSHWTLQYGARNEPEAILETARDITERKQVEEKLRAASLYARSLIEASLDPLVTINADGKITDVNKATEEVTGLSREELIESDFSSYFTEPEKANAGYRQVFTDGFVRDYPLAIRHNSGRITDVLYNATLFKNELDEIQGVFAAARDITEQKQAEQQLKEHAQRTSVLNDIIRVINEASDLPTLFGQALATTFERLGFAAGFIATENESGRLQVRYAHNLPQKLVESLKLTEIDANARLRNVHRKGEPVVVDELPADTLAARCGMKGGAVSLPVFSEGALIGEFTLYALRPHIFTLEERDLLLAIATEFGTALSKLEAQDTARHYSEELARYSAHLEELVEERTAQLHQSEEYFRTLFETSPIAQVRYDVDGRPVRANNAMLDLFGIADVSAIQHITLFASPRSPDEAKASLHEGHPTRYEQRYDFDEIRAQGHFPTTNTGVRYFDMHFAPLFDAATRDVSGYIGQIADITERKRAEEALQDAQRLAGIGETAAMIGHDLRNPLQGLQYIVDLQRLRFERMSVGQRSRDEWEKEQELFAKISEQIFYMDKIVGDLQDYARPLVPEHEEIAVKTLIDDVISSLPPTDGVHITTDVEDLRVEADPHLMHRVFANLFLNAVQAMPEGGTLTVSAAVEDGSVAISVRDTGTGIRTELQDKLFKPLFTGKAKGTGLGLAVVKRIVEAHEGQVTVESEVGKGSTFTVRLPALRN